jgi:hypothetical protein
VSVERLAFNAGNVRPNSLVFPCRLRGQFISTGMHLRCGNRRTAIKRSDVFSPSRVGVPAQGNIKRRCILAEDGGTTTCGARRRSFQ